MLLDAVSVCGGPLGGLAVADVVAVGGSRRAVGVALCLVVLGVVGVGDGHELVGEAKVEVALLEVAVGARAVVPGEVHLASLAVYLHGVPGVAVAFDATVGYASGVEELLVYALVALAGARVAGEAALRAAVVEGAVVLKLVEGPVVQPQGHGVLGAVGLLAALGHGVGDYLGDRWACGVVYGHGRRGAEVMDAGGGVHEVEVRAVRAGGREGEVKVRGAVCGERGVFCPRSTGGVADALLAVVVPVGGNVHAGLVVARATGGGHMEGRCLSCRGVVPLHGEGDAVLAGLGAVGVGGCVLRERRAGYAQDYC